MKKTLFTDTLTEAHRACILPQAAWPIRSFWQPGDVASSPMERLPSAPQHSGTEAHEGSWRLPSAPSPAPGLPSQAWFLASALSGFSRGTAGLCHKPVPCISALVLNSLSEQLEDHMGLYGVGYITCSFSLVPGTCQNSSQHPPLCPPHPLSGAAHSSYCRAWLTSPSPHACLKPSPSPALGQSLRRLSRLPGSVGSLWSEVRLGQDSWEEQSRWGDVGFLALLPFPGIYPCSLSGHQVKQSPQPLLEGPHSGKVALGLETKTSTANPALSIDGIGSLDLPLKMLHHCEVLGRSLSLLGLNFLMWEVA